MVVTNSPSPLETDKLVWSGEVVQLPAASRCCRTKSEYSSPGKKEEGRFRKASWIWLFAYFAVLTVGELYLSPVSLSLYSKASPPQIVSTMMAVNFIPNFIGGGFLQGWLGSFWSSMGKTEFFLMISAIAALAGVGILAFSRPLRQLARE